MRVCTVGRPGGRREGMNTPGGGLPNKNGGDDHRTFCDLIRKRYDKKKKSHSEVISKSTKSHLKQTHHKLTRSNRFIFL